jgi:hypothetical protein
VRKNVQKKEFGAKNGRKITAFARKISVFAQKTRKKTGDPNIRATGTSKRVL